MGGTFYAWLSDSTSSPNTRFTHDGYFQQPGTTYNVANNWDDLTDGTISGINLGAAGSPTGVFQAMLTATDAHGDRVGDTCYDWAGPGHANIGHSGWGDSRWTSGGSGNCTFGIFRLYCFEQ